MTFVGLFREESEVFVFAAAGFVVDDVNATLPLGRIKFITEVVSPRTILHCNVQFLVQSQLLRG